ncbi:MAG: thioredoxin domain-containing protein [Candidatus Thorarchaeota archaeon]
MQRNRLANAVTPSLQSTDVSSSKRVTVTVFTSDTCAFCNEALELVREVASDISRNDNLVEVIESRLDERPDLVDKMDIMALPTILVGHSRITGMPQYSDVEQLVHMSILTPRV